MNNLAFAIFLLVFFVALVGWVIVRVLYIPRLLNGLFSSKLWTKFRFIFYGPRGKAKMLINSGDYDVAMKRLEEILKVYPGSSLTKGEAVYLMGDTYRAKGELEKAIEYCKAFLREEPKNAEVLGIRKPRPCLYRLASKHTRSDWNDQKSSSNIARNGTILHLHRSWAHFNSGNITEAKRIFDDNSKKVENSLREIDEDATFAEDHYYLGILYYELQGNQKKAQEHLKRAIKLSPKSIFAFAQRAKEALN